MRKPVSWLIIALMAAELTVPLFGKALFYQGRLYLTRPVPRPRTVTQSPRAQTQRPPTPAPAPRPASVATPTASQAPTVATNRLVRYVPPKRKVDPGLLEAEKARIDQNTVAWQRARAEEGSASAQHSLGLRHLKGDGVPLDRQAAREYLMKAANSGYGPAQKKLRELDGEPLF